MREQRLDVLNARRLQHPLVDLLRVHERVHPELPQELRPLTPPDGLKIRPLPDAVHTKGRATKKDGTLKKETPDEIKMAFFQQATIIEKLVLREVLVCQRCHAAEVVRTHRCADKDKLDERVILPQPMTVTRWYWEEPFNADSPQQLLAYIKFRGHDPGRNKHSGGESSDRETLEKLARTGDPLYQKVLDYRAVAKVRGTYVKGTEKRLDGEDRLHPTFCLTGDHEVLTPESWVRLDQATDTVEVAQWDLGKLSFRSVLGVTRVPDYAGEIIYLEGKRIAVLMTPNHRVPLTVSRKRPYTYQEATAETLPSEGKIPLTGVLEGTEPCSDWHRLAAAIQADAHWELKARRVRFCLTRRRKQIRLEALLDRLGVTYSKRPSRTWQQYTIHQDAIVPALVMLKWPRKVFRLERLFSLTVAGRQEFLKETLEWDGHQRKSGYYKMYQTCVRENAEIIQTLVHTVGWSASIRTDPPGASSVQPRHVVSWSMLLGHAKLSRLRTLTRTRITAGVYCVTVPSGYFLVKYLDRISVTGNTFKPSTMRLSCVSPNIQNVITDRGGGESLAAGYRRCVTGREIDIFAIPSGILGAWSAKWES